MSQASHGTKVLLDPSFMARLRICALRFQCLCACPWNIADPSHKTPGWKKQSSSRIPKVSDPVIYANTIYTRSNLDRAQKSLEPSLMLITAEVAAWSPHQCDHTEVQPLTLGSAGEQVDVFLHDGHLTKFRRGDWSTRYTDINTGTKEMRKARDYESTKGAPNSSN